jgi:hypothetical protein
MSPEIKMIIILTGSPFIILLIHILLSRIMRDSLPQMIAVKSILLGYFPTAFILWVFVFNKFSSVSEIKLAIIYCFILYTSFAYTYFHFFNTSETARRIRILYEIYKTGSLPSKDIATLYNPSDVIYIRLKRLVAMRQLKYKNGYYFIDKKLLYRAALLISFWRNILGNHGD